MLYEMLAGRPPFDGATTADIVASVLRSDARPIEMETPGAPPSVCAIVRTALTRESVRSLSVGARNAPSAGRRAPQLDSSGRPALDFTVIPRPTRVIVLPFRILKPDPETDFLAFSLPDAVAAALANLESVVVRSSLGDQRRCRPRSTRHRPAQRRRDGCRRNDGAGRRSPPRFVTAHRRRHGDDGLVAHRRSRARRSVPAPGFSG